MRRTLRRHRGLLATAVVLAAALVLAVRGPFAHTIVAGTSMEPTYGSGDLVLLHRQATYRTGDVVAYRVPDGEPGAGVLVIHRIIGGNARAGFLLRGDNKTSTDPWRPKQSEIVGHAVADVPRVGVAAMVFRTPLALALLGGFVTFAIAIGGGTRRREPLVR